MTENEKAFMVGLEELTRQTGVVIGGCGCCGSPFLRPLGRDEQAPEAGYGDGGLGEIRWLSPAGVQWDECKASINSKGAR